jgi:stalled ribosome rescue protein Dom34
MDIQAQVQALIDEAPADTAEGVKIVAVILGEVAQIFSHPQYYVLQNFEQQWQITTLQHRAQDVEKTVLYAYRQLADATKMGKSDDLIAVPVPVVQLLFQFFSFNAVESLLVVDEANNPEKIQELKREDLQTLVDNALQQQLEIHESVEPEIYLA